MTQIKTTRPIYIEVPEKEYKLFKTMALNSNMSLQMYLRNATKHFIKECNKANKDK